MHTIIPHISNINKQTVYSQMNYEMRIPARQTCSFMGYFGKQYRVLVK